MSYTITAETTGAAFVLRVSTAQEALKRARTLEEQGMVNIKIELGMTLENAKQGGVDPRGFEELTKKERSGEPPEVHPRTTRVLRPAKVHSTKPLVPHEHA